MAMKEAQTRHQIWRQQHPTTSTACAIAALELRPTFD
jgi:hypothetical protein